MRFDYLEPQSIEEAVSLLAKFDREAKIIAGGTDLLNLIRTKIIRPKYVVDIARIPGLDHVKYDAAGTLTIGALATIRALEMSPQVKERHPVISQAARQLGSVAIRNVGTVGGNLCHASPAADTAPALIALGARVTITGPAGGRTTSLENFFTGPGRTILKPGEILTEIQVPALTPDTKGIYLKHAIRGASDLAIVGVAAVANFDGGRYHSVRLALGAVAPTPTRATGAERLLEGREPDQALIEIAARAAADESRPITDIRASAEYRREMVQVFVRAAIKSALPEENDRGNEIASAIQ